MSARSPNAPRSAGSLCRPTISGSRPRPSCLRATILPRPQFPLRQPMDSRFMPDQARAWVSIASGELTAAIDPRGAQLSSLRWRGTLDLLWDGDASVWAGRAPLLFPIVGVLAGGAYRLGSKSYALSRHGFARDKCFALVSQDASAASFRLVADESTYAVYPFRFELSVRYALRDATLSVTTLVRNRGDVDMPASFGYHPGFRWPLPFGRSRESHFIEFEYDEPAPVRKIDAAGLLTPVPHPTPVAHRR